MGIIFSVMNQKGGVGKTTTCVNVAHGFALKGYKTLIIDTDPQGNVADDLGLAQGNDLMLLLTPGSTAKLADAVCLTGRDNLHVIRSDQNTASLKVVLATAYRKEEVINNMLVGNNYDVVVIDVSPSVEILNIATILASDYLLIPTELAENSVKGVRMVCDTLDSVRKDTTCELGAIIPTFHDLTANETLYQLKTLVETFGDLVFPPIPADVQVKEASRTGQTLWEYSPTSRALHGYRNSRYDQPCGYAQIVEMLEAKYLRKG